MPLQNSINRIGNSYPGELGIYGGNYARAFVGNAGAGDVDVYTAPSNTRAVVYGFIGKNTAGTTTTWFPELKVSGTYYRIGTAFSTSTGSSQGSVNAAIILEPGESFSFNNSQAGMNLWCNVFEYPSSIAMYSSKILNLSNGANTLYTVPGGKTATMLGSTISNFGVIGNQGALKCWNASTATAQYPINIVPNGGSVATGNLMIPAANTTNNNLFVGQFALSMATGDFLVITTNQGGGTQTAWLNVMEV